MPVKTKDTRNIFDVMSKNGKQFIKGYKSCSEENLKEENLFAVGFKQYYGSNTFIFQFYVDYLGEVLTVPYVIMKEGSIVKKGVSLLNFVKNLAFPDDISCIYLKEIKIYNGKIFLDKMTIYRMNEIDLYDFICEYEELVEGGYSG